MGKQRSNERSEPRRENADTREKPTTPSGDALDGTGEDNHASKTEPERKRSGSSARQRKTSVTDLTDRKGG